MRRKTKILKTVFVLKIKEYKLVQFSKTGPSALIRGPLTEYGI